MMKVGCMFYFIVICGFAAVISQLTGICLPKVMVFETDRIRDAENNHDENTDIADSMEISREKGVHTMNFEQKDNVYTVTRTQLDATESFTEVNFLHDTKGAKSFINYTELDIANAVIRNSNKNYADGKEFASDSRNLNNIIKGTVDDKVKEENCEDSSEEGDSSESKDSETEEDVEVEEEEGEGNDAKEVEEDGEEKDVKEENEGDEDEEKMTTNKGKHCGDSSSSSSSSSSSEEEDSEDNDDEIVDKVHYQHCDKISIGLWNSQVCKRANETQFTCDIFSVFEALRIVKRYVGHYQTEISDSLWTHIQTESILALVFCVLGLVALILSSRDYFREKQLVPLIFSSAGFIGSGVLALVPVARIMMMTFDLLSNTKRLGDRTLNLDIPWSVIAFCVTAVLSMIASFMLISHTWYGRQRKWRLLLKRSKVLELEIAARLQDDNIAKVYAGRAGLIEEVYYDVEAQSPVKGALGLKKDNSDCGVMIEKEKAVDSEIIQPDKEI